jgi:hypothetical protein
VRVRQSAGYSPTLDASRAIRPRATEFSKVRHLTGSTSTVPPTRSGTDPHKVPPRGSLPGRNEPHLGELPTAGGDPGVNEWVRRTALQEEPPLPRKRPLLRAGVMSGIFIVGAAVGLGAAWWFMTPHVSAPRLPADAVQARVIPALRQPSSPDRPAGARGIDRSELPYDGVPPRDAVAGGREEPEVVLKPSNPAELPYAGLSSGSGAVAPDDNGASVVMPRAQTPSVQVSDAEASPVESRKAEAPKADAPKAEAPKAEAPKAEAPKAEAPTAVPTTASVRARSAPQAKVPEQKPALAHRRSEQRSAKDKEIERIRQQAAEELKKKTEAKRFTEEARLKTRKKETPPNTNIDTSKAVDMRGLLARCESASNFIFREQCKWQLCNGKWGKNGCPSYQTQASSY